MEFKIDNMLKVKWDNKLYLVQLTGKAEYEEKSDHGI